MTNIFSLPQEVEQALARYYACFDPDTGELAVSEEDLKIVQSALEELQNQSDEILKWYLEDRANRIARTAMFNSEVERLNAHLNREAKHIDRADMLIGRAFERVYEGKSVNIGTFTLSYRKSEAILIENESRIPSEFLKVPEPPTPKPDKTAIKDALKAGKEVPGASIETRQNLQIK